MPAQPDHDVAYAGQSCWKGVSCTLNGYTW